ncbi:MAG: hypothetical protein QXH40_04905 [Candidatus Bathyarchaeia archaeon]
MTEISEYGDIIINAYMDEWGRRQIDSLLEDGVKIVTLVSAPIIKTWFNSLVTVHNFRRPQRVLKLAQILRTLHIWTVTVPTAIIRQWFASLSLFHVLRRPERKMLYMQALKSTHVFGKPLRVIRIRVFLNLIHAYKRPHRLIRILQQSGLVHTYYLSKPGVKKTKLFLVIGELAFQLSGD